MSPAAADTVVTRFERIAARNPGHPAVEQHGEVTDYARLHRRMREISAGLTGLGVGPGDRVSVRGRASAELVAAVLGVLHSGAVLLLLDEALPAARAEAFTEQVRPRVRLAADPVTPAQGELPVGQFTDAGDHTPLPGDEAYVFFTSGSTGAPKGILGSHRGLAHFIDWEIGALRVGPGDRVAQLTSLSFDVVLRDLFLPLCSGATLVLPDTPRNLHGRSVLPWLARTRATVLHTVPSLVRGWLRAGGDIGPAALRATCFAGEPLDARLAEQWRAAALPAGEIWNFYGPTETTLAKLAHRVTGTEGPGILPVGRPLPSCEVLLVGPDGRPAEPGEVVLRTPFRSRGYLEGEGRRPTGGFRHDPDGGADDWLYHTGDLASRTPDGHYVVHGRRDDQVKIRGLRVEPAEVAAQVRGAAGGHGAGDAFVTAVERPDLPEKQLVALVDGGLTEAALADVAGTLRERLPLAMVPSVFRSLPVFPLTANGKVDRAALRTLARQAAAEDAAAPAQGSGPSGEDHGDDPVLAAVCAAMATALGLSSVAPDADFFALGGDSLAVAELLAILADEHGLAELGHTDVLRAPGPAALAARIGRRDASAGATRFDPDGIPHTPVIGEPYPLSPQQRRFAAFYLTEPPRNWSNVQLRFPLPEHLGTADLRTALRVLVARHPSLRTRFTAVAGTLHQEVRPPSEVPLDLPEHVGAPGVVAARLIAEPVPVDADFPWSATVARGADGAELILTLNHMVTDGTSQTILRADLDAVLAHLLHGSTLPPPQPAPAYVEYARRQNAAEEADTDRLLAFWRQEFAGLAPTALPRPAGHREDARGAYAALGLDLAGAASPGTAARELGCTPFALMLGAFTDTLAEHLGRDELAVQIPSTGRPHPATLPVVGNFHNIVPVRLSRLASPAGTAREAQAALARSLDHQWLQLDTVVRALGMDPAAEPYPLSSLLFNAIPGSSPLLPQGTGFAAGGLPYDVRYDLMGVVRGQGDTWVLELHYRCALLDPQTAERLLRSMAGRLTRTSSEAHHTTH